MMLSSSVVLVAMSLVLSVDSLLPLYFIYVLWASLVICFLSRQEGGFISGVSSVFWFCVLLVSVPCSVSIFYKLLMSACIYSCSLPVLMSWVIYSISEQFYLVKLVVDTSIPRSDCGSLGVV